MAQALTPVASLSSTCHLRLHNSDLPFIFLYQGSVPSCVNSIIPCSCDKSLLPPLPWSVIVCSDRTTPHSGHQHVPHPIAHSLIVPKLTLLSRPLPPMNSHWRNFSRMELTLWVLCQGYSCSEYAASPHSSNLSSEHIVGAIGSSAVLWCKCN